MQGQGSDDKPTVVFLHGLARSHRSLNGLRKSVEEAGYPTWARTYPSRRMPIGELADQVAEWIAEDVGADRPLWAVSHSLGGILVRHLADRFPWRGAVMLAPPNRGSRVATAMKDFPLFKWYFGPAGQDVAQGPEQWPAPPHPTAVIAGTKGSSLGNVPSWVTAAFRLIPKGETHDGTITVEETRLPELAAHAEVDASHTFIMNHPRTRELVLGFLECGAFPVAALEPPEAEAEGAGT